MTTIIDGKAVAAGLRADVARSVAAFSERHGRVPGLATVLVGDDPASAVYVANKQKATAEVGMRGFSHELSADTTREELVSLIQQLNADPAVSGILCQLPLPAHLDDTEITNLIDATKDVDGLSIANAGLLALGLPGLRPCTPTGVMVLLEHARIDLAGAHAVVLGRSNLFGKPMAQLLLAADATVTTCHSRTRGLAELCRGADVLIAAVGRPRMVKGDWIRPGAVVVDVGINRTDAGLVADVDQAAVDGVACALTPSRAGSGR